MRVVIVGGGILGLATARLVAREVADAEVVVLEKERDVAQHQTAHNSGVVHAGLYYAPGSLKARLCRHGMSLLKAFCLEREIPYDECGKLVIATGEREMARFDALEERARANGVPGLQRLGESELRAIEPSATGIAALHSPATAIVDFVAVAHAIADDARAAGATIRTGAEVGRVLGTGRGAEITLANGTVLEADRAIVCAGLHADRLARASRQPAEPRIMPFRGEYWQLRPERRHLVRGLIYPVPDPALPFLGIHLTRKVGGSVLIGPNAILAFAREGYRRTTFDARDLRDALGWPGAVRLFGRYWRVGVAEIYRTLSKRAFISQAQRYVPELTASDAIRAPAGVRAQAVDRDGTLVDDFRLGTDGPVLWVRNAPSPAATSSLAIAEEIVQRAGLDRVAPYSSV
jgi:L-2-hydroxyglutarate oxidase LhgO